MSAPLILPKGNDRSWTREFYRAINKVTRRMWWLHNCDAQIQKATQDAFMYGSATFKIGLSGGIGRRR